MAGSLKKKKKRVLLPEASNMSKKLINDPAGVVDEALAGLVAACPGLKLLEGHRVIIRADVEQVTKQGKVTN